MSDMKNSMIKVMKFSGKQDQIPYYSSADFSAPF
jgi:hypothetical protein